MDWMSYFSRSYKYDFESCESFKRDNDTTTTFLHVDTQITQTIKWSLATIVTWFKVYLYLVFMTCSENHETWLESMDISLMGLQSPVLWKVFSTSMTAKSDTLMNWLLMVILTTTAAWCMCT